MAGRLSSDERLARLVSRGSTRAFAQLYQRHHQALYRYCRSIVRDREDAQDALQSTMTRAFAALRAGERDLAVRPWLFRIAHNESVSILRRRRPHADLEQAHVAALEDVESSLARRERLGELLADLEQLGKRQRAALLMRELSGLSLPEIAGALSITPGAAKQALFEARTALQEFAEGRAMKCETVRRAICEDRRMLRGRKVRAHVRHCESCGALEAQVAIRGEDLRALAPPLPAVAASATLAKVLAGVGAGAGGHGAAALSGTALGKQAAVSLTAKAVAGVAVMAVAVGGTARLALHHSSPRRSSSSLLPAQAGSRAGAAGTAAARVRAHAPPSARRGVARRRDRQDASVGARTAPVVAAPSATGPTVEEGSHGGRSGLGRARGHDQGHGRSRRGTIPGRAHPTPSRAPVHPTHRRTGGHGERTPATPPPAVRPQPPPEAARVREEGGGTARSGTHTRSSATPAG